MDTPAKQRRAPRSDGQRNRRLILEAAARAFATEGAEASLNAVARDAGVGIATVFRHFPTREALVEAIYRDSLEALCAAANQLADEQDAVTAIRAWMGKFLDYIGLQSGMAETLRALIGADADMDAQVGAVAQLTTAVEALLDKGRQEGIIATPVLAVDVVAALTGTAMTAGRPAQRDQADRLVDLLVAGITADRRAP
ncbi:MAG TPA: helix-turn-helix domain-containing protein [Pseudonocardiaceae bacterium]|jgi:AcrR family transcriptional regulator|nr:helix-turn-helix domain-containing protein [Pseudonocardiaceae bacterium]